MESATISDPPHCTRAGRHNPCGLSSVQRERLGIPSKSSRPARALLYTLAALPAADASAGTIFAAQFAAPAVKVEFEHGRYDPARQIYISDESGEPAFLHTADTTIKTCQFKRPTGSSQNPDWEYYDAPDGFD
jgi:hypothetical protein